MAEPTYTKRVGRGHTASIHNSLRSNNAVDDQTVWGYKAYVPLRDGAGNEVHIIMGTGAPSADATYDSAPLASIYINISGGDGACMYLKEATGGSGWAAVTTGGAA